MDILNLFPTEEITVTRRGEPGAYTPTWRDPVITMGMVSRKHQTVTTSTGETITTSGTVAVDPSVQAAAGDRITIQGTQYTVLDVSYTPPHGKEFFPDVKTIIYGENHT